MELSESLVWRNDSSSLLETFSSDLWPLVHLGLCGLGHLIWADGQTDVGHVSSPSGFLSKLKGSILFRDIFRISFVKIKSRTCSDINVIFFFCGCVITPCHNVVVHPGSSVRCHRQLYHNAGGVCVCVCLRVCVCVCVEQMVFFGCHKSVSWDNRNSVCWLFNKKWRAERRLSGELYKEETMWCLHHDSDVLLNFFCLWHIILV